MEALMKALIILSTLLTTVYAKSMTVQPFINSGKIVGDQIVLEVSYSGGCGSHNFELKIKPCRETHPVMCDAILTDTTDDYCEAMIITDIAFPLDEIGLDDSYYSNGSLTIFGAGYLPSADRQNASQVTLKLPEL